MFLWRMDHKTTIQIQLTETVVMIFFFPVCLFLCVFAFLQMSISQFENSFGYWIQTRDFIELIYAGLGVEAIEAYF